MLDVTTVITINGPTGQRFLSSLATYEAPLPPALQELAAGQCSIEVDPRDAEEVASFVEQMLDAGWIELDEPPLLFSPRVGDYIVMRADVLAEVGRETPGLPPTWGFIPRGTRGKLIGWRDRTDDVRAIIEVLDAKPRLILLVGERHITRIQAPKRPPLVQRRRPVRRG